MRGASALLLLALVAGCAPTLEAIRPAAPAGTDFFSTLAREQRRHALALAQHGASLPAAERFARKADAALRGQMSEPEPATTPDLAAFLDRLGPLLDSAARERCPVFAALALARYDAWAEREAAWPGAGEAMRFRHEARENLSALAGPCAFSGQAARGP